MKLKNLSVELALWIFLKTEAASKLFLDGLLFTAYGSRILSFRTGLLHNVSGPAEMVVAEPIEISYASSS